MMLKDFLSRIERSRVYRQLRTLVRVVRGDAAGGRNNEGVDLFLTGGYSIQKISALLLPGIGGPELVYEQLRIQEDIRAYALSLEKTIEELHQQIADMQRAQIEQAAQQAKAGQQAPAAPVAAPDLLDQLLGVA